MESVTREIVPFVIKITEERSDYNLSLSMTIQCLCKKFLIRNAIVIKDVKIPYEISEKEIPLVEFRLTRWLYTHVWYYDELSTFMKIILFFVKSKNEHNAKFKQFRGKTYILELK